MITFICSVCIEKSDDPEEYTYPISELANPDELNEDFWICKECHENMIIKEKIENAKTFFIFKRDE